MGAGTYANAASPGPGLLRRRYSVPEIIMRKHTLAQQKTDDEPLWLHHDSNHNVIEVVVNKQAAASARGLLLNGRLSGPRTPPHRKSFGLRHHPEHQHGSLTGRSSSVESGGGGVGTHDWLVAGTTGTLTATGSDPNLAALKHRNLVGRCSSPLCNGGVGLGRAMANGTGGSLRSMHNNSLSCSSSSSVNGVPLANGGVVVGGGVGVGGCGHHQQQQQHYPVVPSYRDGDYSMRKTTLLRRMWSRELRRYERSGSWSPPLRRAPRRIYSVESIVASVEGRASRADDAESVASRRPGSSSDGSGRCATTATTMTAGTTDTTTTTGTTSCLECAKLEAQYSGDFGTGRKLLSRARSRDIECCSSGDVSDGGPECPVPVSNTPPTEPVDDRRQQQQQQPRRRRRMCSSQTADLGESEPIILAAGGGAVSAAATTTVHNGPHGDQQQHGAAGEEEDEDEYASHSSSVSSIASQSYRVPSASRRPDHELSEFLQQERLAAADGDGADRAAGREVAAVRTGSAGAGDHPRERAPAADGTAGTATAAAAANATEPAERGVSEQQDNALSAAAPSEDSSESSDEEGDGSDTGGAGDNRTPHAGGSGVDEAEQTRLDEYISGLLLDNLNNIADAKELVLATDARDGETILGVYSERRAQLADHGKPTEADRQNNNNQTVTNGGVPEHAGGGTMKQKLTEKYIGDGGGVVCNSPPQPDKRKLSPKPGDGDGAECDKENEEDVANNNGNGKGNSNNNDTGEQRNHRRQKHRSKGGFFLRSGSRSPRPAAEPALNGGAAEIDLNGKYYFPAYGLETDPSDNTDIASEPEGLVLGKIGTGSTYDRGSAVVPRFSAMPRTESMEVQPSSTNSAEDDVDGAVRGGRRKVRADEDDDEDDGEDDEVDDSDASSLVDSLDGFGPPQMVETVPPRSRKPRASVKAAGGGEVGESTTSSTDRSPRHEKGEAFFVPIHAERAAAFKLDERVVVADTMPLRIKERLNNRRRLMKWKQEQENLKKQRKMMRLIEQKRFYGEPAIQVISTIDKAISRKEFIPPGARKSVFGGAGVTTPIVRDTSTPSGPTPFRAMKPKKRAGGPAATGSTGSALRSELGMLESYKIDGKGNMQIQTAAATASSAGGRKGAVAPVAAKGAWGMGTERRQASKTPHAPTTATTITATASTTVGGGGSSARTSTGVRTGGSTGKASGGRRRQQVLKDVQQMTLYPQADLTPDIEGGPRRVYQKTEIQEGDKHIEILEIVECADSAPRNRHGGGSRPARVHSAGRRGRGDSGNRNRSRIPVPIYRFGQYRRSTQSRDGSPLSTGSNPKVDRMIADLLLEALTNPEEVGVKLVRTPDALRDASRASSKARPSGASASKKSSSSSSSTAGHGGGGANGGNNNLLTPRRTASGRYTQKFEVIPEERSSVSIESSTEELSTGGGGNSNRKKGPLPSPRRVSFDENHQILNRDELEGPTLVVPTVPSPKRSKSPAKSPTRRHQPTAPAAAAAASPAKKQGTATVLTNTTTNTTATATTTTTSRGKAAIQSDVIEEKGWIGFSTQHEDMATPIHNGPDDEDTRLSIVPRGALEQTPQSRSPPPPPPPHVGRSVVRTITIGNCVPDAIEHHLHHHREPRTPEPPKHAVSNSSTPGDGIALGADAANAGPDRDVATDYGITTVDIHRGTACCPDLSSTAESFATDSLNTKLTPLSGPSFPSLPTSAAVRCCETIVESRHRGVPDHGEPAARSPAGTEMGDIVTYHHHHAHHHPLEARLPGAAPTGPFQHQIREENAWQVFQAGDCKVIQSKIEYYETSIHRTPLTGGGAVDLFASESTALCPHTAGPLSTADSLEGSWHHHRQRTTSFGAGSADTAAPPKTADTTCSSCCFCNPERHNHATGVKPAADGCFYCRAKLGQSPTRSFPAPPTPPNIQTSPVPPSPQTPIAELTPTPSLHEITVPVRKSSLAGRPLPGRDGGKPTDGKAVAEPKPSARKGDVPAVKTKQAKPPAETVPERSSKLRSTAKSASISTTTTTATTVSTVGRSEEGPQKPLPPIPGATTTPKMARKKGTEAPPAVATAAGGVLNRPKYTNHLTRASTVVQSVQKEVKNELRPLPIRVLPKTAKEVSNRKEKERQIGLSLPKDYDRDSVRAPQIAVAMEEDESVAAVVGSADTHGYDNETSSSSDTSDGNSSIDSSPNVSPFKRPNLQQQQQQQQSLETVQPPTAATRWKTNSERNLSQLAIQKLVSASRWGSKWRKGAARGSHQQLAVEDDDEPMPSMGSCSELSPLKTGTSNGGPVGSTAGTTTSNIISGITQTSSNQGWTVTVAGNYNPEMAPDVEMRLSFPKGAATGPGSGGKSALTSSSGGGSYSNANGVGRQLRQAQQYADEHHQLDGGGYLGAAAGSRSTSRAGTLPPASSQTPSSLNPRRNLTRSDGTGAGTGTGTKDYRLPNVGPTHNILARPTARKAIKTVECSVVASATRTIANSYHQLSHQHQMAPNSNGPQQQQQQQHHAARAPPMAAVRGAGGRSRPANQQPLPQPSTQVLHPALQNGSGGKFLSSSSPSLVSQQQQQQQHPSQRYHHNTEPPSSYHLEDYGNGYYGQQQQQPHPRRMSLDSQQYQHHHQQQQQHTQHHPAGSLMATDCLSVMGNAIAPEIKPRVPTMSEKDLTRRHHVCYTRTQPYFS
ncbi:uncharacterized protein LOC121603563 isoform X4 [Anopheles merus]|nr:uncharacterized protein LOC121603563 isoform X4 [Anopheles merus]